MTGKIFTTKNKLLVKLDTFLQKNIEILVQVLGWLTISALLLGLGFIFNINKLFQG